jgi:hypothetical protein
MRRRHPTRSRRLSGNVLFTRIRTLKHVRPAPRPIYSQVVYCLDRVPAVVEKDPKFKNIEPFKTFLSGNREAIAKLSLHDLERKSSSRQ